MPAAWSQRAMLIADRNSDFKPVNQAISALFPQDMTCIDLSLDGGNTQDMVEEMMDEWARGVSVINYTGHGARGQWGTTGILYVDDIPHLSNEFRLPVVVAMNCLNGFFHHIDGQPCLGEALLLEPTGGGIAYWGPTAVTSNLRQQALAESFYKQLFNGENTTLGQCIRKAKQSIAHDPANHAVLATWILLGDPALRIRF